MTWGRSGGERKREEESVKKRKDSQHEGVSGLIKIVS